MSAFNIQLSFKLNIEPPENMYTFNIQPSLKLNVEPQDLDEVQKRFNEIIEKDEPIKMKINLEVQDEVKDENKKCQEQNDTPTEIVNIQDEEEDTNLTIDKCLENSKLSPTTCKTYKSKIKNMIEWVSLYDTFASKKKQETIIDNIKNIDGISNRKQYLSAFKVALTELNINDMCNLNEELQKIRTESQDKNAIKAKANLKPIEDAYKIMNWLNKKLEEYKQLSITGDNYWANQMWGLLEVYTKGGVVRSDDIINMRILDEDYNPDYNYYDYDYNIYFKKSKTMMIVNHKTDKKAQGKDKLKVRVFQLELESLLHREESDDIFFQQKTNRGQIYKDTSGLNKALKEKTALDLEGLKKSIGRDDLNFEDLRKAKVSIIFDKNDEEGILLRIFLFFIPLTYKFKN